ncbi:diguanylate cyclase domain-containing protein [Fibrobacter sp.]|uniref:sensor domain-containing diguanylate cyclase n=1 Tax=Fibrobacter sp. TaxID=35828 RepID=UPI00386393AF
MDLQEYVDQFDSMTCIMSVEKKPNGYGKMCIEVGNKAYIDSFKKNNDNLVDMPFGNKFVPGQEYTKYIPKDLNFEHFIYSSAILKKPMHAYIHPERFDVWFNIFSLPLDFEDPFKCYCTYTQEISTELNTDSLQSLSAKTTADVLKTCIKLRSTKNFLKTMDEVIADIRNISKANYCCIMLTDFKAHKCSLLSENAAPEIGRHTLLDYLNEDFINYAKSWLDIINGSTCLIIKDEKEIEDIKVRSPHWYESIKSAGIHRIALFPLRHNDETIGFIWASNFAPEETDHIKETLELSTYFIASEIANYKLLQRLETLSSTDLLTGVKNRNAMNNRVIQIASGRERKPMSYGIIFADLNSLKTVNDKIGHNAGDKLLVDAAEILKTTFSKSDIYRAGGDEFLIIDMETPKDVLSSKVETLQKKSDDPNNISFAIGFYYEENGGDIRAAMHEADSRMYEDKKAFYDRHPECRNR